MPKNYKAKIEWKEYEEKHNVSFEEIYAKKLQGYSWSALADGKVCASTMRQMTQDWCAENDRSFERLMKNGVGVTDKVNEVDTGKVKALWNAGWSVKMIAVDCYCTEDCVREIVKK